MNFALKTIEQLISLDDYALCYIGVYDFDSRPNFKGICYGLLEIKQKAKMGRKISVYCVILHNILLRTVIPWINLSYLLINLYIFKIDLRVAIILMLPILRTIVGAYALIKSDTTALKLLKKRSN